MSLTSRPTVSASPQLSSASSYSSPLTSVTHVPPDIAPHITPSASFASSLASLFCSCPLSLCPSLRSPDNALICQSVCLTARFFDLQWQSQHSAPWTLSVLHPCRYYLMKSSNPSHAYSVAIFSRSRCVTREHSWTGLWRRRVRGGTNLMGWLNWRLDRAPASSCTLHPFSSRLTP